MAGLAATSGTSQAASRSLMTAKRVPAKSEVVQQLSLPGGQAKTVVNAGDNIYTFAGPKGSSYSFSCTGDRKQGTDSASMTMPSNKTDSRFTGVSPVVAYHNLVAGGLPSAQAIQMLSSSGIKVTIARRDTAQSRANTEGFGHCERVFRT
jgi:hypothetical protein